MNHPCYFLPGFMCDQRLWQQLWLKLNPAIEPQHITYPAAELLTDISLDLEQQLAEDASHLVGFSMGGYLALDYAIKHPQRVNKLVIIAATGKALPAEELAKRDKILRYAKSPYYQGSNAQRIGQFIHPQHATTELIELIQAMDKDLGKHTLIAHLQANAQRPDLWQQLKHITCPVLLIAAAQDNLIPLFVMEHMVKQLPNAQLKVVDPCGHMLPLEAAEQLANWINPFLTE